MLKKQQGMTFIEVLVALFILVTGILGAVAMQTTAKQSSFDAMQRSLASSLAQDIIERMRNNDADTTVLEGYEGSYGASALSAPVPSCTDEATACNFAQRRVYDLYEWSELLRGAEAKIGTTNVGGLVNGRGCITHNNQIVTVVISWEGKTETNKSWTSESCGTESNKRRQLSITAYLF